MLFGHDEGKNIVQLCNGEKDVVCVEMGGTGADSLSKARQNINYIGTNPIEGADKDTPANWRALGSGVAYISGSGQLKDQPAPYGFIKNYSTGTTAVQTFISYSTDSVSRKWTRMGQVSWSQWVLSLDERDSRIQIDRLWNNDSTASSFPKQTLSMDLSDYPILIVFHKPTTTQNGALGTPLLRGWDGRLINTIGGGTTFRTRTVFYDTSGITFYTGYSGATEDNTAIIPVAIYGIKEV